MNASLLATARGHFIFRYTGSSILQPSLFLLSQRMSAQPSIRSQRWSFYATNNNSCQLPISGTYYRPAYTRLP